MLNVALYWIYIFLIVGIAFIPGFAIATCIRSLSNIERLATSFGFSFLIVILLVPLFAIKLDILARVVFIAILIASSLYLIQQLKKQEFKLGLDFKFLILILTISLVSKFFIQTLWEYPVMGGDWYGHTLMWPYRFAMGDWMPPRDRPPLFNLLIYPYHQLLGTSLYQYWVSQIISVVANSVFIIPAYLIAKNVFGDRVGKASAAFMLVCPFLVYQALYTWPKNLAMYFALLMVYFLFFSEGPGEKTKYSLAGFFGALGFLTHNYVMFYILASIIALIYIKKVHKQNPLISLQRFFKSKYIYYFIAMVIVVSPYFLWVYSFYGTISTSRFIYYPFAVEGYSTALNENTQELFKTFYSTPVQQIIVIRIMNALVTLTPAVLPINPIATNFRTYNPIYYYSHDYPGALSTLMYLLVVVWFVKYLFRKTKTDVVLVMLVVVPIILTVFMWGWCEWGLVPQTLHPTIPILIMLGLNGLYKTNTKETKPYLTHLIFLGCMIENVIYGSLINKFYYAGGGIISVEQGIRRFIPNFQVSDFVSAHFLLNTNLEFLFNFIISIGIIITVIYAYSRFSKT